MSKVTCPNCKGSGSIDVSRLKSTRLSLGLKQEELADAVGVTRAQIANIETGRSALAPGKIKPMAIALNITTDDLLTILYGEQNEL